MYCLDLWLLYWLEAVLPLIQTFALRLVICGLAWVHSVHARRYWGQCSKTRERRWEQKVEWRESARAIEASIFTVKVKAENVDEGKEKFFV